MREHTHAEVAYCNRGLEKNIIRKWNYFLLCIEYLLSYGLYSCFFFFFSSSFSFWRPSNISSKASRWSTGKVILMESLMLAATRAAPKASWNRRSVWACWFLYSFSIFVFSLFLSWYRFSRDRVLSSPFFQNWDWKEYLTIIIYVLRLQTSVAYRT